MAHVEDDSQRAVDEPADTSLAGDKPPRYIPRPSPLDSGLRRSDEMGWPEWRAGRLDRHYRLHVAGGEGVHVGEDEVAGAVAAELGLVLPADYGEGAEDVAGVVPG